jgi:hypothetical protein
MFSQPIATHLEGAFIDVCYAAADMVDRLSPSLDSPHASDERAVLLAVIDVRLALQSILNFSRKWAPTSDCGSPSFPPSA